MARVLRVFGRGFQFAASGAVVLGSTLGSQASTFADRQLLAPADRELHVLLRQSWLLAEAGQWSGRQCIGSVGTPENRASRQPTLNHRTCQLLRFFI